MISRTNHHRRSKQGLNMRVWTWEIVLKIESRQRIIISLFCTFLPFSGQKILKIDKEGESKSKVDTFPFCFYRCMPFSVIKNSNILQYITASCLKSYI